MRPRPYHYPECIPDPTLTLNQVRTALVPLDVAKTLMQSSPEAYPALRPAIVSLWAEGGLASLYRSSDVTAVAGLLLGGCGFGVNEFLRRCTAPIPMARSFRRG